MLLLSKPNNRRTKLIIEMWRHLLWSMSTEIRLLENLRPKLSLPTMRDAETKLLMAVVDLEQALRELETHPDEDNGNG